MTNSELKEYAAANHSRLRKQKVALGDLVMILVGRFAGINGVIKGISVYDNDFADPYYEIDMHCEVPDKYKCRKTLIQPNNVIGGLSASDFEVICSRTPESDIKEAEPKPKFKVGDKVEIDNLLSVFDSRVGTIAHTLIGETMNYCVKIQNDIIVFNEGSLSPYPEPTAEEEDEKELAPTILTKPPLTIKQAQKEMAEIGKKMRNPEYRKRIDEEWRKELAAKIAVAYAEKGRYEPEEICAKAVEVANGVVERLKNEKQ